MQSDKFEQITIDEVQEILGLTIKRDEKNKLLTFLAQLSAYTEDSQFNVSFIAPSSSGKSFIPLEIAKLFPSEDVIKLGSASPTSFYHEQGIYNKERNTILVDLSQKIIIFLDQPGTTFLSRLRSMLSHDEKEIVAKITDKNQQGGNRTKTVIIKGFPVVIFCTAGLRIDEQESTRFLLLSPEINQEKIRQAVLEKVKKESNSQKYGFEIESDPKRKLLKERIQAIKELNITSIQISSPELVNKLFFERSKMLKPRHQRDIGRITAIIKVLALLNAWFRELKDGTLITNDDDVRQAFQLWDVVAESQELNLPPYIFNLYKDVILTVYIEKNNQATGANKVGVMKQEIFKRHHETYGRYLPDWQLRQDILPTLETSGLITIEHDPDDKRKVLIYPTTQLTISEQDNSIEKKVKDALF